MSRQPMQPGWAWTQPEAPATHDGCVVPKVAPFGEARYLMVGFLGGTAYAGEVVFRDLIQHEDGTLGTKWPIKMIPRTGAVMDAPVFRTLQGNATHNRNSIHLTAPADFSIGALTGVPQNVRISVNVKPATPVSTFGLCMRGAGTYETGCELRFDPQGQRVQYGPPAHGQMASKAENGFLSISEIERVGGLNKPFHLDIIVKNDFVDRCIDDRRTLISRCPDQPRGDRLFFFVKGGEVLFEDISIRALL